MKRVHVQYFALLREQARCAEESVATTAGTPAALYRELAGRHGFTLPAERARVALDGEFAAWVEQVKGFPGIDPAQLPAFGRRMFGGDFLFAVTRDFVASCRTPMLLMPGDDVVHPVETSGDLKRLVPDIAVIAPWKGDAHKQEAMDRARAFFIAHAPR